MTSAFDLVVAMPCFNEADGLSRSLGDLVGFLRNRQLSFAIVIQDDCSTDSSPEMIRGIQAGISYPIELEENSVNLGHGPTSIRAYARALRFADCPVLFLDSDGQYLLSDLQRVLDLGIKNPNTICVGVRTDRQDPLYRRFVSVILRVIVRARFRVSSSDPNTPVRLYPHHVLEQLSGKIPNDSLIPNIWLTVLAGQFNFVTEEIKIRHRQRVGENRVGSTWRTKNSLRVAPVLRLFRFALRATSELILR